MKRGLKIINELENTIERKYFEISQLELLKKNILNLK